MDLTILREELDKSHMRYAVRQGFIPTYRILTSDGVWVYDVTTLDAVFAHERNGYLTYLLPTGSWVRAMEGGQA